MYLLAAFSNLTSSITQIRFKAMQGTKRSNSTLLVGKSIVCKKTYAENFHLEDMIQHTCMQWWIKTKALSDFCRCLRFRIN